MERTHGETALGALTLWITRAWRRARMQPERLDPTCPKCGSAMARRTSRRAADAGRKFWGCVTFPKCSGARDLG
jgi:restriction system protein